MTKETLAVVAISCSGFRTLAEHTSLWLTARSSCANLTIGSSGKMPRLKATNHLPLQRKKPVGMQTIGQQTAQTLGQTS